MQLPALSHIDLVPGGSYNREKHKEREKHEAHRLHPPPLPLLPADARAVEFIDESAQPELAERYDYYRVPSFFLGTEKLYEASPLWTRAEAKRRLGAMIDAVLEKE